MPEMADAGENHRQTALVGRGDDFIVTDGAAGLNRAGGAGIGRRE